MKTEEAESSEEKAFMESLKLFLCWLMILHDRARVKESGRRDRNSSTKEFDDANPLLIDKYW
jgi:hypothetical protein